MWWNDEQPKVARTKKNVLRWYPQAGKLQVARPDWTDENGEIKTGKTATVDVVALHDDESAESARMIFQEIADALR